MVHQLSCYVYRLKRSCTSPHSPGPHRGTLGSASRADDAVDVWTIVRTCRRAPHTGNCCCCEPEFHPTLLLLESRHDALDSPSTPCIRVPSPFAWDRNNDRELRAQRRHVLGGGVRDSILTASPFSYGSTIGVPAVDCSGSSTNCWCMNTWYLVRGTCGLRIIRKKWNACFYLEPRIRFDGRTRKFKDEVTNRKGKTGPFLTLKNSIINGLNSTKYSKGFFQDTDTGNQLVTF